MQYLAAIILYILAHDSRAIGVASSKLQSLDLTLDHVKDVLDDWVESIPVPIADDDEASAEVSGRDPTQVEVLRARATETKTLLDLWLPSWPTL